MPFCSNCGNEVKENTKFCPKCGNSMNGDNQSQTGQNNTSGIICSKCGSTVPFANTVCLKCGTPINQESHTAAIVIGYLGTIFGALLIPIIGLIIGFVSGIYLLTKQGKSTKIHGVIIIVITIIIALIWMSYMSYVSRLNSFYY